jgi:hypothetical protein
MIRYVSDVVRNSRSEKRAEIEGRQPARPSCATRCILYIFLPMSVSYVSGAQFASRQTTSYSGAESQALITRFAFTTCAGITNLSDTLPF